MIANPIPEPLEDKLLAEVLDGDNNPGQLARKYNLRLTLILDWLALPQTKSRLASAIEAEEIGVYRSLINHRRDAIYHLGMTFVKSTNLVEYRRAAATLLRHFHTRPAPRTHTTTQKSTPQAPEPTRTEQTHQPHATQHQADSPPPTPHENTPAPTTHDSAPQPRSTRSTSKAHADSPTSATSTFLPNPSLNAPSQPRLQSPPKPPHSDIPSSNSDPSPHDASTSDLTSRFAHPHLPHPSHVSTPFSPHAPTSSTLANAPTAPPNPSNPDTS